MEINVNYKPEYEWFGRSLENYVKSNPKAAGAKTLTQARKMAFGEKHKTYTCRCSQPGCRRQSGAKASSC